LGGAGVGLLKDLEVAPEPGGCGDWPKLDIQQIHDQHTRAFRVWMICCLMAGLLILLAIFVEPGF